MYERTNTKNYKETPSSSYANLTLFLPSYHANQLLIARWTSVSNLRAAGESFPFFLLCDCLTRGTSIGALTIPAACLRSLRLPDEVGRKRGAGRGAMGSIGMMGMGAMGVEGRGGKLRMSVGTG